MSAAGRGTFPSLAAHPPIILPATRASRARLAPLAAVPAVALARVLLYDPGLVNYDSAYGLSWGAQLAGGHAPGYDVPLPPTPHPLLTALGALLSPFGGDAAAIATGLFALALGALVWIAFALGRELGGPAAGVAAALLAGTRDQLLFWDALSFVDVPFAALVLAAILAEVREPRRERAALACLAVAGLLRPEAWLLGLGYALVLRRRHGRLSAGVLAAALAAPVTWVLVDLVTTGRPLYSFTLTHRVAAELHRTRGPGAIPFELPRFVASDTRWAIAFGAVAGAVLALRRVPGPARRLLAAGLAATAATALVVAAGTPLLQRYVFVPAVVGCVLCGFALATLAGDRRWRWAAAGLAVAIVLELAVADGDRYARERADVRAQRHSGAELGRLATSPPLAGCTGLVAPSRLAPWLSLRRGEPADRFLARGRALGPRVAVLAATGDRTAAATAAINGDPPPAPAGPVVAGGRYWTISGRC